MGKRTSGEGTISKRIKDGKVVGWRGGLTVGHDEQGKQLRRWVSGQTREEVVRELQARQRDLHDGKLNPRSGTTLGQYLDEWLNHKEHRGIRPNTLRSYRDSARLYLKPHLGRVSLEKLSPRDVEQLLVKLRKAGKSPAVTNYALQVLRMALKRAVHLGIVPRNVAVSVEPLRRERAEMSVWTAEQAQAFLNTSRTHRLHAAYYLAVMSGMRRGEILGLKWKDIDWEGRRLHPRQQLLEVRRLGKEGKRHAGRETISSTSIELGVLKTAKSKRRVILSPGTLARLREHQAAQSREKEELGPDWDDEGFVFADPFGKPTLPRTFYGAFRQLMDEAGVPRIRLHDLRHSTGTYLISRGHDPVSVAALLGHKQVSTTLNIYAHALPDKLRSLAYGVADLRPQTAKAEAADASAPPRTGRPERG